LACLHSPETFGEVFLIARWLALIRGLLDELIEPSIEPIECAQYHISRITCNAVEQGIETRRDRKSGTFVGLPRRPAPMSFYISGKHPQEHCKALDMVGLFYKA